MSESVFDIQKRIGEVFKLHNQPTPSPQFDERPEEYRQRLLVVSQHLLPKNHVWSGVDIRRQPERALDSVERALVHDRVQAFKSNTGPLRELSETCPRTGRVVTKFYGDTRHTWEPFTQQPRRATFTPGVGRGADSVQARAAAEAGRHEQGLAFAALARERAAAGR